MALVKHDFCSLKLSNSFSKFYKCLEYIISKSTAVSFREKNTSFIVNNLPFVGVIFLSDDFYTAHFARQLFFEHESHESQKLCVGISRLSSLAFSLYCLV